MMAKVFTLLRKELVDASRDKRSVLAGLYYAIGTPLLMCGLFIVLINQLSSPEDLPVKMVNADKAPDLVRYLGQQGINSGSGEKADKLVLQISSDYPPPTKSAASLLCRNGQFATDSTRH
jgi:sodium transport system permease protein